MPLYRYECTAEGCGLSIELVRSIDDRKEGLRKMCCGKPGHRGLLRLVVQPVPGIVTKPAAGPRKGR